MKKVHIIGAGLAGSEAAYQLAKRGFDVHLYEMRPVKMTPAHQTGAFAELVCSNSLRSNDLKNAVGVLKEEMRFLDSLIIHSADTSSVPAGGALAVDRNSFSENITNTLTSMENITIHYDEVQDISSLDGYILIASGPLTSEALTEEIQSYTGSSYFYFYDAAAPIITKESIDFTKVYRKSRYKDEEVGDYINCPMTEEEFTLFYDKLLQAESVPLKSFEELKVFEGCMPFEVMAKRGKKTLLFGPMKPVGLRHPETQQTPYAVVQLRQDDAADSLYNIVGFQTHLKWGAQKEIIQTIPGLEKAEIVRYGVMHRNSYLNAPQLLEKTYQLRTHEHIYFGGQITGVEGYVESAASGLVAALSIYTKEVHQKELIFPKETVIGSMAHYISDPSIQNFQPMNANFGLLPAPKEGISKKQRKEYYSDRALQTMQSYISEHLSILQIADE